MNHGTKLATFEEFASPIVEDREAFYANPQVLMDEISPEMIDEIASNYSRGMNLSRPWEDLDSATRAEIRRTVKGIVSLSLPVLLRHEVVNP